MGSEETTRSHILQSKYIACNLTYHLERMGKDCYKEIILKAKFSSLCIRKTISH